MPMAHHIASLQEDVATGRQTEEERLTTTSVGAVDPENSVECARAVATA